MLASGFVEGARLVKSKATNSSGGCIGERVGGAVGVKRGGPCDWEKMAAGTQSSRGELGRVTLFRSIPIGFRVPSKEGWGEVDVSVLGKLGVPNPELFWAGTCAWMGGADNLGEEEKGGTCIHWPNARLGCNTPNASGGVSQQILVE